MIYFMCLVVTLKMIPPKSILSFGFQGKSSIFPKKKKKMVVAGQATAVVVVLWHMGIEGMRK